MRTINFRQLIFAREYRGYSQTKLASMVKGLSQSNLSNFEKGICSLSEDIINKIIDVLGFPEEFYEISIGNRVENSHYRRKSCLSKGEKSKIEYSDKLIGYIIDNMGDSIEYPEFTLKNFDLEDGYSPEYAAQYTRKLLGIKEGPVDYIIKLFEQRGIIVVEMAEDVNKFDGVSFITDKSNHVIIINKNFSNDHKRYTLAHELGHIIMHLSNSIPDFRDKENEAYKFASEFLMPEDEIKNSLIGVKTPYLMELKSYWLTSMASIARRAMNLKCIDKNRYTNINIELSRNGYRKHEPINVFIDTPFIYNEAYMIHKNQLGYSDETLAKAFDLPIDVIKDFCSMNKYNLKLKISKN